MAAVGYLGNTNDIADLVAYLVSPAAHYITGMYPSSCTRQNVHGTRLVQAKR